MRRHIIQTRIGRKEYFQDMHNGWDGKMLEVLFINMVRQRNVMCKMIAVFRVRKLKQKAFDTPALIPGTFKSYEENKNAK